MKIHIVINELVLDGFNFQDHRRISIGLEQELKRIICEHGPPKDFTPDLKIAKIDVNSFDTPADMNPKKVGARIGRLIYGRVNE
jgi:hypothetical protein